MMRRRATRAKIVLTLGALLMLPMTGSAAAQEDGEQIYQSQCSSCHGADGLGIPGAFPPLVDNPNLDDSDYVARVIRDGLSGPITVNGQSYDGAMPPFGGLSDDDVASLVAFLQTGFAGPVGTSPPATDVAPPPAADGAAALGEDLFLGATGFTNGGMACMACHTAGEHGNLGGNGLGPDLTDVHSRLGGTVGLTAVLENPSFAVMRTAYEDKPITEQERLSLAAFFESTVGEERDDINWLVLFGLEGAAFLFVIMIIFHPWRGSSYANKLRRST
ncbi:MAG: cytochrome c [Acidimicrobiia bacterium]|nr:cytochrome c [Acidimicrobiia bacterium]